MAGKLGFDLIGFWHTVGIQQVLFFVFAVLFYG